MTQYSMTKRFGDSAIPVMNTLMRASTTLAPVQCVRTTRLRERVMSREYCSYCAKAKNSDNLFWYKEYGVICGQCYKTEEEASE